MKINVTYLKSLGACEQGLADFRRAFPRGLTVKPGARLTPRMAERLYLVAGYFDWFVDESDYVSEQAAADMHDALAPAREVRINTQKKAALRYGRYTAEYDRVAVSAWAEYDRACVRYFWQALGGAA